MSEWWPDEKDVKLASNDHELSILYTPHEESRKLWIEVLIQRRKTDEAYSRYRKFKDSLK